MPSLGEKFQDLQAAYGDDKLLAEDIKKEMKQVGETKSIREKRIKAILELWEKEVNRKSGEGAALLEGPALDKQ